MFRFFATVALVVGVIVGLGVWGARSACYARWNGSGETVRWSFKGDCQIKTRDGTWLPEERFIQVRQAP